MQTQIELTAQPIPARPEWPAAATGGFGAVVEFQGLVRGEEAGQPIAALEYEAYVAMAERLLRELAEQAAARNGCLFIRVIHRVGIIPAGEAAVYVAAGARHRAGAFAAVMEFMDQLKQDVPIWKCRALPAEGGA